MKEHEQCNYFLQHPSEGRAWLKMWKDAAKSGHTIVDDELIELENKLNAAEKKKGHQSSSEITGTKSNIISLSDKKASRSISRHSDAPTLLSSAVIIYLPHVRDKNIYTKP